MKLKFMWGIIMLGLVMVVVGCAAPASQTLDGCEADLSGVFLVRRGADSAVIMPTFTVSNPNPYMVTIDDLVYKLDGGLGFVVHEQIPYRYYIPAGETITIQGLGVLDFTYAVAERLFDGDTVQQAVPKVLPAWTSLGTMPAGITKDIWDMFPAQDVTFTYEVSVHTSAQGMEKRVTTTGTSEPIK